jgi:hypothetical protein
LGLEYTTQHVGSQWILEGDMTSTISRSDTVTMQNSSISQSLPAEVLLIDNEPIGARHFRWIAQRGQPLELAGPLGSRLRLEVVTGG